MFLPSQITIPKEGEVIPIGMINDTPVALWRDKNGRLIIGLPERTLAVKEEDVTPENIVILMDKFYEFNRLCPPTSPKRANGRAS